jgi:hypothetical protein
VHDADTSDIERLRLKIGRAGVAVAMAGLAAATVLFFTGQGAASVLLFQISFGVLLAMPVKNVLAVIADEIRRRDWWFAVLALGVLAELTYTVLDRVR